MWYVIAYEDGQEWDARHAVRSDAEAYFEVLASEEWVDRVQLVDPEGVVVRDTDVDRDWLPRLVRD